MKIPPASDPIWREIVTGQSKCDFDFLAAKLLQVTLARSLSKDPSPSNLQKCCETLRELFLQNADQPLAQNDLKNITTKEIYSGS